MPSLGIFRTLRELLRSARTHGDSELEQLRAAAAALKQDVDLMCANQEKQREQEEQLVLQQLKKTVQALQAEGKAISDQQHAVERAFDALSEKAQAEIMEAAQAQAQQRVDKLLEAVDVGKFLHGAPLDECIQEGHKVPRELATALKSVEK